jgi:hypothetical protein
MTQLLGRTRALHDSTPQIIVQEIALARHLKRKLKDG